jgi:hypothetical protein
VAVLVNSDLESEREKYKRSVVVHYRHTGEMAQISFAHPAFYPLCYPLFHFRGEDGWHIHLRAIDTGIKVTFQSYAKYILQVRDAVNRRDLLQFVNQQKIKKDVILCGNSLTQQYICDLYIAYENDRLEWIRMHQKELKAELYSELREAANKRQGDLAGKYFVLPHTHVGSPRWYYGEYQDGMARCRALGKPDLFITFTCNPNWPEIEEAMKGFEEGVSSRPDLIARVFQLKLEEMMKDIEELEVFGRLSGFMYTMEWQKRGLPHAHILLFLDQEDAIHTVADIDKVVCAELPDPSTNPELYRLIKENMIHGPCGQLIPNRPCCSRGSCEEHYPKNCQNETLITEDSYPHYRRRSTENGGHWAHYGRNEIFINNGWVVPYNAFLMMKYRAHINVEICCSVKAIKYLHKYIFKGKTNQSLIQLI